MSDICDDLRRLVRDLVERHGTAPELWASLRQAGIPQVGAQADEESGDLADLVACVREAGRSLVSVPLIASSVAHWVAEQSCSAELFVPEQTTVALLPPSALGRPQDSGSDLVLPRVAWPSGTTHVLVAGDAELLLVRPTTDELSIELDLAGRPVTSIRLNDVPGSLHQVSGIEPRRVAARIRTLAAAELLGVAEAAMAMTRAHVSQREQFGAPLVQIPAVAQTLGRLRSDLLASAAALTRAAENLPGADRLALVAVSATAGRLAAGTHQLHGALGVTKEYPLHHLTCRLWADQDAWEPSRAALIGLGEDLVAAGEREWFDSWTAPAWWVSPLS